MADSRKLFGGDKGAGPTEDGFAGADKSVGNPGSDEPQARAEAGMALSNSEVATLKANRHPPSADDENRRLSDDQEH